MGYNEDQAMPTTHFKVELDDNEDDDMKIDQVVPTHSSEDTICEDSTLDVIVLYVN